MVFGPPLIATGVLEPAFGLISLIATGLSEPARFFDGLRDAFAWEGINDLRANSDGSPMADFGLRASKLPDDLGVDFGDGEKDFLE